MKIIKYTDFKNEGIISKGLEIINYKTIKENDKIAKKYIDMIYENYNKHKNLMAVSIAKNKSYNTLTYKISNDPYSKSNTIDGREEFIEVKLMSINKFGWKSDITRARIEVRSSKNKMILGRDMKTKKNSLF